MKDNVRQRFILFEQGLGLLKAVLHTYEAKEAEKYKAYHKELREFINKAEKLL